MCILLYWKKDFALRERKGKTLDHFFGLHTKSSKLSVFTVLQLHLSHRLHFLKTYPTYASVCSLINSCTLHSEVFQSLLQNYEKIRLWCSSYFCDAILQKWPTSEMQSKNFVLKKKGGGEKLSTSFWSRICSYLKCTFAWLVSLYQKLSLSITYNT